MKTRKLAAAVLAATVVTLIATAAPASARSRAAGRR